MRIGFAVTICFGLTLRGVNWSRLGDGLFEWISLVPDPFNCLSRAKHNLPEKTNKQTKQNYIHWKGWPVYAVTHYFYIMVCHVLGVTLKYSPKAGQCQAICCDGAGGELTVEQVCTPDNKCEGIEPDEKLEDGHCPGDDKATCPDTCESDGELYRFVVWFAEGWWLVTSLPKSRVERFTGLKKESIV